MPGMIDLHCHWVSGIDDGARTPEEGLEILARLRRLGFTMVLATPHMRPGLFDNSAADLRAAFERMQSQMTLRNGAGLERPQGDEARFVPAGSGGLLPEVGLSSEHYFDEVVLQRILRGEALPYPGRKAILLEFYEVAFSPGVEQSLFQIQRLGLTPVIAHPERYRPLWERPERLARLVDLGCVALLDACAVVGKYGQQVRACALTLLERELYGAACSDAHRPGDVDELARALHWIEAQYGQDELTYLFREGPLRLLSSPGSVSDP